MGKSRSAVNAAEDILAQGFLFDVFIRPLTGKNGQDLLDIRTTPLYFLARVFARGKNVNGFRAGLRITDLPLGRYLVVMEPRPLLINDPKTGTILTEVYDPINNATGVKRNVWAHSFDNRIHGLPVVDGVGLLAVYPSNNSPTIYRIMEKDTYTSVDSGFDLFQTGRTIKLEIEGGVVTSNSEVNKYIETSIRRRTISTEQSPAIKVVTVSEVVEPYIFGENSPPSYKGYALLGVSLQASERLQAAPDISVLVTGGRKVKNLIATGYAGNSSTSYQIVDGSLVGNTLFSAVTSTGFAPPYFVRNLTKGIEAQVSRVGINTLDTSTSLQWAANDQYLLWSYEPSCYFPDVFLDTLINPVGGVGSFVDADVMVDYESLIESRQFCVANKLFFDGVVNQRKAWAQFASEAAVTSLLYPSRINGRYGLKPEQESIPTAIFNDSNIIKDSFSEEFVSWHEQTVGKVLISYLDGRDGLFRPKTIQVVTLDYYLNPTLAYATEESLDLPYVTNKKQAARVGAVHIKSRLLQKKVVKFKVAMHGMFLQPSDLIVVQHRTTQYDAELNGFVLTTENRSGNSQKVTVSSSPSVGIDGSYSAAIWFRHTGNTAKNLSVDYLQEDGQSKLQVSGLTEDINQGDILVVGKDIDYDALYRVSQIDITEGGEISITATLWVKEIVDSNNCFLDFSNDTLIYAPKKVLDSGTPSSLATFQTLEQYIASNSY